MKALLSTLSVATLLLAVGMSFWAYDVHEDRKHTITIEAPVPMYAGRGDEGCGGGQIAVVQPRTTVRIRRIRYWKNCATIDVALSDGRTGYLVPSAGEITVTPPLGD